MTADSRSDPTGTPRPRRPLFYKYFAALFIAVVLPLLANGASEAWFGYRDQRAMLNQRLRTEAARVRPISQVAAIPAVLQSGTFSS